MVGKDRQGKVKNSIGNVEAKELICTTHGHELKGRNAGGRVCVRWRGIKGGKWDNCSSIINKIYFLKIKKIKAPHSLSLCVPLPSHILISCKFLTGLFYNLLLPGQKGKLRFLKPQTGTLCCFY